MFIGLEAIKGFIEGNNLPVCIVWCLNEPGIYTLAHIGKEHNSPFLFPNWPYSLDSGILEEFLTQWDTYYLYLISGGIYFTNMPDGRLGFYGDIFFKYAYSLITFLFHVEPHVGWVVGPMWKWEFHLKIKCFTWSVTQN